MNQAVGRIEVEGRALPVRGGLMAALEGAWQRLAAPGTWWTGAERLAIAAEVRAAFDCPMCHARNVALSPYADAGTHPRATELLPQEAVDAVHRLATDSGRVTEAWVRGVAAGPLGEERYVELVSVVAIVTALDRFELALGRPGRTLPAPVAGQPTRRRPAGARRDLAWVATLAPDRVEPGDPDPYPRHGDKNIHRAVSLVPQAVIDFFDLDVELYLEDWQIRDFANEYRAVSHAQIELVAARASALARCHY